MKHLINAALVVLITFALAFALAASIHLDRDFTPPATQDALESAERNGVDTEPEDRTEKALRDPRVQRSLRLLCASGEKWACGMVVKDPL